MPAFRYFAGSFRLTARLVMAAMIGVAYPATSRADEAIRLSWQDFVKDPNKVASLRKAVAAMKARNSADHNSVEYRKSWEYWANIHGYFGPDSPFGTVADNKGGVQPSDLHFFDGITDISPPDQVATDVWANCEHGTPWFFAWHRLYLLYFEKQLQAAAGDPTLRLPYWDYTDPAQLAMPAEFTQPTYKNEGGAETPNPLYEARRAPGWAKRQETLDPNSTNVDGFLKQSDFSGYQSGIELNVHGYVHCTVGVSCPVPDMGAVPYSSNDPIFWLHHANIDRLWSCWSNIPGHKNPTDGNFVNQSYSFVNATGVEVTNKVADVFSGDLVDYKYEKETGCARSDGTLLAASDTTTGKSSKTPMAAEMTTPKITELLAQPRSLNSPTKPVSLSAATTKVKVELRTDNDMKTLNALALGAHGAAATTTQLILSGIKFAASPGAQFYVYLEDPADPKRREYAGTISFFGAIPGVGAHERHKFTERSDTAEGLTRQFDVTEALRKLGVGKAELNAVTVSFEATNGRVGSRETPEINAESHLTVNSIDFRISAGK